MPVADVRSLQRVVAALARGVLGDAYVPEIPGRIIDMLSQVPSRIDRDRLTKALTAMDTRIGALALTGRAVPVSWLSGGEAERLIQSFKASRMGFRRDLAGVVVTAATSALYGWPGPAWERIGYPGPLGPPPDVPKAIDTVDISADERVTCDVVVVGSGAGGGCVAGNLALAGLDVVVVEKGAYHNESDFSHVEAEAFRDMYLYGATLTTADLGVRILAGSTLGGGTVVNWSTSWKTPVPVLQEWADVSGIDAFRSGEMDESLDEVCKRLSVNLESSVASKRDGLMERGLRALGWHVDVMPRNVVGCTQDANCGYCPYGCRTGAKQSSLHTYLHDAAAHGARTIVGADVRRINVRDGRASGVEAVCNGHTVVVDARAVVVAGGSIESPALLLRSGLRRRVGSNLRLHPGTGVGAVFDDEVHMWEGGMQCRYSGELKGPWQGGYGCTLETGPLHPGGWSTAVPWTSSRRHRELMDRYANTSLTAVLSRDTTQGRVKLDRKGDVRIEYSINEADEARILDGTLAAARVMEAAGAELIYSFHSDLLSYRPGMDRFDDWAERVRAAGFRNRAVTFASFHQMGSCAMGVDPSSSVVGPNNESHEVAGLFVVDASTFPTPSGVNPMISIYGIANRASKKLIERLS